LSSLRVDVVRIEHIEAHPNADRLDIAFPFGREGWPVVVQKARYAQGDLVIYCPVDSILPVVLEDRLFPPGSAIKLNKSRIKAIRIRGLVSQGMIIDPADVADAITPEDLVEGNNVAEKLGISKYEPPANEVPTHMRLQAKKTKPDIKAFHKYTNIEHGKYWTREIRPGDEVVMTTKLHGTSFRAGWFKTEANTWWQKTLKFLHLLPEWTFAWGSRNVQIQAKWLKKHPGIRINSQGVEFGDVYSKMVKQYDLRNRIPKGMAIYGEIVGDGIQKGYRYGCGSGEYKLYLYDINFDNRWLDYYPDSKSPSGFFDVARHMQLETVPVVYRGPFTEQKLHQMITVNPLSDEVNEGLVIRPVVEKAHPHSGRVLYKWISDEFYLQKDGSDFH